MKCIFCKKTMWFWQNRSSDDCSHINCHRKNCLIQLQKKNKEGRNSKALDDTIGSLLKIL